MFAQQDRERGFTLIEILVVVLIIGILTAFAVPMFLNQRKDAVEATLKTDLGSAAIAMETEMVKNKGSYLSYLPNYENRSDGVKISLRKDKSSSKQFCLEGHSDAEPSKLLRYDSLKGGLLPAGEDCGDLLPGETAFNANLSSKKVLFLISSHGWQRSEFTRYGFGNVTFKADATLEDMEGYDIIAAFAGWHSPTVEQEALLKAAYDAGHRIVTDGNDTGIRRTWMFPSTTWKGEGTGMNLQYTKTGASGLNPTFPYTFTATAFDGDGSWACNTRAGTGTVAIATSMSSEDTPKQCITAAAATNSAGGRWFHMTMFNSDPSGGKNVLHSGIDWLLM